MTWHAFLVALVLTRGCVLWDRVDRVVHPDRPPRIACIGDSNTMAGWPTAGVVRWCEYLAQALGDAATVRNYGFGGATICDIWPRRLRDVDLLDGQRATRRAIREGTDVAVLAYGTNDVRAMDREALTQDDLLACFERAHALLAADGARVVIALAPPIMPSFRDGDPVALNDAIERLNDALRERFPADEIVDFHDGFDASLFREDGIHLNDAGQHLRAERALAALRIRR